MSEAHTYTLTLRWIGNTGSGTRNYQSYSRDFEVTADGKASTLAGSADASYRGDGTRWNPEEMLLASLSACHKLWYLHLAAAAGITVESYCDQPVGTMQVAVDGGGEFTACTLRPTIVLADASDASRADGLHAEAHALCFIARSVRFPVHVEASYR